MDEQDVKVILPPEVDQENADVYSTPPAEESFGVFRTLMHILPLFLSGIAILFFSCTAAALVSAMGLRRGDVGRVIIGEFAGGAKNVLYSSDSNDLSSPPSTTLSEEPPDQASPSSDSIYQENTEQSDYVIGLNNETPYTPDMTSLSSRPRAIPPLDELRAEYGKDAPLVLIIHTHGSEGYIDSADSSYRTSDKEKNVVAVGKVIAGALNAAGVPTIHCDVLFDEDDFNMAYYNSSLEIRRKLAEYPSISYIIDVHRDSVTLVDGTYIPLKCTADGQVAAQLMFVIGTDHGGSGHTGWEDNLALAARLQDSIHNSSATMMRNINLRSASFNQQYRSGALLLEVGSCSNTLKEAKISAGIFADALIREIKGY